MISEFVKSSVIFGCAGPTLTEVEFDFFRENLPFGFILFSRNIANIEQVKQLCRICDEKNIPIMCYGIRTDFRGELFPGSLALLSLADNIIELKTICEYPSCSRKATMIARYDKDGEIVLEGNQIDIGADKYKVYCRKHYRELTKII